MSLRERLAGNPAETAALGRKLLVKQPVSSDRRRLTDLVKDEDFADLYSPLGLRPFPVRLS
jgi:hypothetical protein